MGENTKLINENFHIYGVATFIYACIYAFCMFDNPSGITYSVHIIATIALIIFVAKKLDYKLKKASAFYIVSMILLSISTFCTDDGKIIFLNKIGTFLLTMCFMLDILYDTRRWNLGKFLKSIITIIFMTIGEIFNPFIDFVWFCKNKLETRNNKVLYVIIGMIITIPLFLIVFFMLTSADAVFRNVALSLFDGFSFIGFVRVCFMIGFMFFVTYCIMSYAVKREIVETVIDNKSMEPLIAIPMAMIMTMLYLVFSVIQIVYLFIGNMELPDGYTYAEYAREGFFQLLFVSIINLFIVLMCLHYFRPNKLLKAILVVMSLCTFIMIASSAMRMIIYIQYYYLTFLRLFVLWSLTVLIFMFIGVVIYVFKDSFPLFRYSMVVVTCMYIILAFAHPDFWIAKVNLEGSNKERSEFFKGDAYKDYGLFADLSADATPVLVEWIQSKKVVVEKYNSGDTEFIQNKRYKYGIMHLENVLEDVEDMGIREFNVSRYKAKQIINEKIIK